MANISGSTKRFLRTALADQGAASELVTVMNKLTNMSGTELERLDSVTAGTVAASKALVTGTSKDLTGMGPIQFTGCGTNASVAAGANAVIMGVGTTAQPCSATAADKRFLEFLCKTTASSGDNRLAYLRYDIGGAGGGECLRAFTTLTAATGTAHGAHVSLNVSATGYVSGLGAGVRGQLYVQGIAPAGGTYYGAQAEMYFDASATIAAATKHAVLSVQSAGNATAMSTCLNAIAFDGTSANDATKMISSVRLAELPAGTVGVAVLVNGTRYYMPCVPVAEWN